jgi:hypothetical protein
MTGAIVRIALRYIAAALVAKGLISPGDGNMLSLDPDIAHVAEIALGLAIGVAVEGWYALAKRMGWST